MKDVQLGERQGQGQGTGTGTGRLDGAEDITLGRRSNVQQDQGGEV